MILAAVAIAMVAIVIAAVHAWYRACARRFTRYVDRARTAESAQMRCWYMDMALVERQEMPRWARRVYGVD